MRLCITSLKQMLFLKLSSIRASDILHHCTNYGKRGPSAGHSVPLIGKGVRTLHGSWGDYNRDLHHPIKMLGRLRREMWVIRVLERGQMTVLYICFVVLCSCSKGCCCRGYSQVGQLRLLLTGTPLKLWDGVFTGRVPWNTNPYIFSPPIHSFKTRLDVCVCVFRSDV